MNSYLFWWDGLNHEEQAFKVFKVFGVGARKFPHTLTDKEIETVYKYYNLKTDKMSIYKKLAEIQKSIRGLEKNGKGHNYDYVTGDKLLGVLRPLMVEKGVLLKQEIVSIENTRQDSGETGVEKIAILGGFKEARYGQVKPGILSKVMMKFTWVDSETGETDVNLFGANGYNGWDKGVGSALTYGERYFLLKYFHIPTDEDDIDKDERPILDEKGFAYLISDEATKEQITEALEKRRMSDSQRATLTSIKNK